MAARRDRERRRPSGETRYRFATPDSVVESDQTVGGKSEPIDAPAERQSRSRRAMAPEATQIVVSARGGVRPASLPFSAYATEYAYVARDLRRVALVIGSLLVILILLNFVLPH